LSDEVRNSLESNQSQTYLGPAVTIASSASGAVCAGTSVTFTATTYNFSGTPTYQWYKNSVAINGANSATYSTTSLTSTDVISVSCSDASSIVSDNSLSLWLDAANGTTISGNTWSDLSGKGKHATLTSDQSYSSGDGGTIQFNGGQNAVSIPLVSNKTTDVTMQTWVYLDANTKGPFFKNGSNNGYVFGTGNGDNGFEVGNKATMLFAGTRWIQATNTSYGYGWKLVTMVINSSGVPSMFINDSLVPGTYTGTSAAVPTTGTYLGRNVGDDDANWPKFNGKMGAAYFYTKALSQSEITQNYNALAARFGLSSSSSISSNAITTTISPAPSASITVLGDGCINKTTLSTLAGLSYSWYKDNVAISNTNASTYTPTTAGDYKVQVTSGSCSTQSTATTISVCGVTADGKMGPLTSSALVSREGATNNGNGIDERGLLLAVPWTYGTVTSPYTSKVWMDRNLGATQAATSVNDVASYGDLYQWGRATDGGQLRTAPQVATRLTDISSRSTNSISAQPWTSQADWNSQSGGVWAVQPWNNTDGGVNNPCPTGFRVPSFSEWTAELDGMTSAGLVTTTTGVFNSFLKIPQAGVIEGSGWSGTLITTKSVYWTTDRYDTVSSREIRFSTTANANPNANWASFRYSVRCIAK
jgi:uncharacterized protein (TIGR02145 family)